jgi:hypothetical protein
MIKVKLNKKRCLNPVRDPFKVSPVIANDRRRQKKFGSPAGVSEEPRSEAPREYNPRRLGIRRLCAFSLFF